LGNEIEEMKIGRACSTQGKDEKLIHNVSRKNLKIRYKDRDGRIMLKCRLKNQPVRMWTGFVSGQGPVAGSCEHFNESQGFIKCWSFLNSGISVSFSRRGKKT
jgi:hypothetical protein